MENLSPLERDLYVDPIDHARFWVILQYLETHLPEHGGRKYSPFQAVRLRFYHDGSIAHTYQEIADFFGSSPEYVRRLIWLGLREMRHPRVAKHYRRSSR